MAHCLWVAGLSRYLGAGLVVLRVCGTHCVVNFGTFLVCGAVFVVLGGTVLIIERGALLEHLLLVDCDRELVALLALHLSYLQW